MAWTERYVVDGGAGLQDGTSEANAWSLADAFTNYADGQRVNLKGSFAAASSVTASTAPTTQIRFEGYTTTPGDGGRADITFAASNQLTVSAAGLVFVGVDFTADYSSNRVVQVGAAGDYTHFHDCTFRNNAANGYGVQDAGDLSVYSKCRFYLPATTAARYGLEASKRHLITHCVFQIGGATGCYGVRCTSAQAVSIHHCQFLADASNTGAAISISTAPTNGVLSIMHCDMYRFQDGVNLSGLTSATAGNIAIVNNIVAQGTNGIVVGSSGGRIYIANNAFDVSGTEVSANVGDNLSTSNQSLSGDPFVDAANGDFDLDTTAGEGAACRDAAQDWPAFV